jgi:hypothetical protein
MEMLKILRDTPLPTFLVIAGIFFLVLALVSQIGNYVTMPVQRQKVAAILGAVLLILGVGLYLVPAPQHLQPQGSQMAAATGPQQPSAPSLPSLPIHAQLTTGAWVAFNRNDYDDALKKAKECTDRFGTEGLREQQEYTSQGAPSPPKGAVSDDEKRKIFSRGVLNDVGTCYFIEGQALEKLSRINEAKEAYKAAKQFPDARAWDTGGFFWSPAQSASDRFSKLP